MTINAIMRGATLPLHEVDILLAELLHKPKDWLYAHPEYTLSSWQQQRFKKLCQRRQHGEPIAYLTGHKEFYGFDFIVNRSVLIPRPDTELLIDQVNTIYRVPTKLIIADIGTGSGNIAITLKKLLPQITVLATDISPAALQVMKKNCRKHHVTIPTFQGDALQALPKRYQHQLDVIVCNAPYLSKTEARKQSLAFEPQLALTPPGAPTSIIAAVITQSSAWLKPTGMMLFEIGHRQARQVQQLCRKKYPSADITVQQDLGKFDRLVLCRNLYKN